jgi:hypothetical protein
VSIHRKPELAQRRSSDRLPVGKDSPRKELWHTEWASPIATTRTIQNQAPQCGWSFRWVLFSPAAEHITINLGYLGFLRQICTSVSNKDSRCLAKFQSGYHFLLCARYSRDSYYHRDRWQTKPVMDCHWPHGSGDLEWCGWWVKNQCQCCTQVEGTRGDMFTVSPIAFQS